MSMMTNTSLRSPSGFSMICIALYVIACVNRLKSARAVSHCPQSVGSTATVSG
jgi:hypothetical protein